MLSVAKQVVEERPKVGTLFVLQVGRSVPDRRNFGRRLCELKAVSALRREAQTRFEPGLLGAGGNSQFRRALKARWIGEPLKIRNITSTEEVRGCVNLP
ncbi:MAG TPA: hypothetical protein VHS80_16905, partial [Chthoniobacterales bacterium]|nr:hypothetical protein [Chthoniobacterales bacterium]